LAGTTVRLAIALFVIGLSTPVAWAQAADEPSTSAAPDAAARPRHPNSGHVAGIVLTAVGGAGVLAGVVCFVSGALAEHPTSVAGGLGSPRDPESGLPLFIGGGIAAGVGFAALVAGIVLLNSTPSFDDGTPSLSFGIAPLEGGAIASLAGVF
jgi:hypothetical protein